MISTNIFVPVLLFILLTMDLSNASDYRQRFPNKYTNVYQRSRQYENQPITFRPNARRSVDIRNQDLCLFRPCYPNSNNLLLGRENEINASSTCGTFFPTQYCTEHFLYGERKCPKCHTTEQTRNENYHHGIEHVVKSKNAEQTTWWQSDNGKEMVTIQLNLERVFTFEQLTIIFNSTRPAAMLIERSSDFGQTWEVYRYFAYDCSKYFPRSSLLHKDAICDEKYSNPVPSVGGLVKFRLFDQNNDGRKRFIQNDLSTITNIRVNFTKIHDHRNRIRGRRAYYAISNMIISGSCFCNGHASSCSRINDIPDSVGHCICSHNTEGENCERCISLYNDRPWISGKECQQCNCNDHADSCHFNQTVYERSQRKSGGVCDNCKHNTEGQNCQECKPTFYRNPIVEMSHPEACIPCTCDSRGSLDGRCTLELTQNGAHPKCQCKLNVMGDQCDQCKLGFSGLSAENPDGCDDCNPDGTLDSNNGICNCKPSVTGAKCDQCENGYYGLSALLDGCQKCDCDLGGANETGCDVRNGRCRCRLNLNPTNCDRPLIHYYIPSMNLNYRAENQTITDCESQKGYGCSITLSTGGSPWNDKKHRIVNEGTTLSFNINDLQRSMNYDILLNYQLKNGIDSWNSATVTIIRPNHEIHDNLCNADHFHEKNIPFELNGDKEMQQILSNICLIENNTYILKLEFDVSNTVSNPKADIIIDYVSLIPKIETSPFMDQSSLLRQLQSQYKENGCNTTLYKSIYDPIYPSYECLHTIHSISTAISNGADFCGCNTDGSTDSDCKKYDGYCSCKQNIVGRRCDRCENGFCNFPFCDPCPCNSHSQQFDSESQTCLDCEDNTTGRFCDLCVEGYYGNARTGSCLPCRCPDTVHSNRVFGIGCDLNENTYEIECVCKKGYAGSRCDECAENYFGNPQEIGGSCQPCNCNGNIDENQKGNCDRKTGECLKCIAGSTGRNCQHCSFGYYRGAQNNCIACNCDSYGSLGNSCNTFSGRCTCKQNIIGNRCDECKQGYWNLASGKGCEQCQCDSEGSENLYCNKYDGQCKCHDGYEGIDCSVLAISPLLKSLEEGKNKSFDAFKQAERNYLLFSAYLEHPRNFVHEQIDIKDDLMNFFAEEEAYQSLRKIYKKKPVTRAHSVVPSVSSYYPTKPIQPAEDLQKNDDSFKNENDNSIKTDYNQINSNEYSQSEEHGSDSNENAVKGDTERSSDENKNYENNQISPTHTIFDDKVETTTKEETTAGKPLFEFPKLW